jgi:hypothetical protein
MIASDHSLRAADHFRGPLWLNLDAGFHVLGPNKRPTVVRKRLASPA